MNQAETADSASEIEMDIVGTRVPMTTKERLEDIAEEMETIGTVTISDVLREAIDDYIDSHDTENANE